MLRYRTPIRTLVRGYIAYVHSNIARVYVVNEFPKSGGTWISNLLSNAVGLSFYDNVTPSIEPQVLKGHYIRGGKFINRGVTVWRDGRDVMLSYYHHSFFKFTDIPINHAFVDMMRSKYGFSDYADVQANLPAYLEGEFKNPSYPSFTWSQFVENWHDNRRFTAVRYEDFRSDPVGRLTALTENVSDGEIQLTLDVAQNIVDKFDIKNILKNRNEKPGERFFVRSGKQGGWRDQYSNEAVEIFDHHAGHALKILNYD